MTLAGTAATIVDTTSYPVTTQATKTEKFTIDGGTEQTVTFTTAINQGRIVTSCSFPITDQNSYSMTITINGGSPQTITFGSATTTAAHVAAAINAQLSGGTATTISTTNVAVVSDTVGATSTIAATSSTGTDGVTWSAATVTNTAAGIASQLAAQLEGVKVSVNGDGQVLLTTDSEGSGSSISNGTGTADLTWASATAGTGQSATVYAGTLLGRNSSTKKLTVYSSTVSLTLDEPVAVMPYDLTWAAAGDKTVGVIKAGALAKNRLREHDNASALDTLVLDKLTKNSGVVAVSAVDVSQYAN
jgi:hypothetical protein